MIGNDVIDLSLAKNQNNWQRKGYLTKIFTELEQLYIRNSPDKDRMVWSLWSRKEAVYKIIIQKGGKRGYYPIKIESINADFDNGITVFENNSFYTKTLIFNDLMHSLAVENKEDYSRIIEVFNSENIVKKNGIPFYELNSKFYSASKSHHGQFEKIVYLK